MKNVFLKKVADIFLDNVPVELKHFLLSLNRFHLMKGRVYPQRPLLIQLVDGREMHGGLADRLKSMVSAYCIAQLKDFEFRIKHTFPFPLEDYLLPNQYNWRIRTDDPISSNFFEARIYHINKDDILKDKKRIEKIPSDKQLHCYCKGEIFKYLKHADGAGFDWSTEFNKLFKPSPDLHQSINTCKAKIGGPYLAAVFRFQNLLGDFPEYQYHEATDSRKEQLIRLCIGELRKLQSVNTERKILVTADSQFFLQKVQYMEGIYAFPAAVVHVDCVTNADYDTYLKSFVDFYLIAEADSVLSIGTKEMYKSNFPNYAAQINNVPFGRILIEES